ncbi:hypothetical protein H0N99_03985 [Candidatus Micrarchaeota archaeon]|nr:hypothetical protein [Candidatus Micrarchaeota archaeon]
MKAQSAIEFITAYSWAFLLILVVGFIAFYYISVQQPSPQCDFGTELQCQSFQFVKNSSGSMRLVFQLNNGMGKAVSFTGNQIITVTNIGKSGVNSYTGSCWSNGVIVRGGDPVYCTFSITDSDVIPSLNRNVKFDVALNYVDCETSPDYPVDCYGGLNRTYRGAITAPFEARPSGVASFCGDGTCDAAHGETCASCTQDCGPCLGPSCQPDCTFGISGLFVCNSSCLGINGCAGFFQACNKYAPGYRCSDSSGGTTGALNYKVQCCNNSLSSAPNCYQTSLTTVGYCGNSICDTAHGENCSNCPLPQGDCPPCPSICLSDCTMGDSICHASCSGLGGCQGSTFKKACDSWALNAVRCSNSTGGLSGSLDSYTTCCTGAIGPALHCYQNTSKTIGWCGDHNCAASRGETCGNCVADCGVCPPNCQPDCMFGGVCNSNCPGCSNVLLACNATFGSGFATCVNSTGGTTPEYSPLNLYYNASCCGGTPTLCGSNSTCPHTTIWCNNSNTQNCSTDTLLAACNFSCTGNGACGTSCTPTCKQTCTACTGGKTCNNGVCVTGCQPDCTYNALCNTTCPCTGFHPVCDKQAGQRCSDATGTATATTYYTNCCNGTVNPAPSCYQMTQTTVGYCGDFKCDASNGETTFTCPKDCCNGDCSSWTSISGGTDFKCHSECAGYNGCSTIYYVCNTLTIGNQACSNSTGGTTGGTFYNISTCCSGAIQSCGLNSTCPHSGPWCNGAVQNCSADTVTPCTIPCPSSGSACGSCTPTCGQSCAPCGGTNSISCNTYCNSTASSLCTYSSNPATCTKTCTGLGVCGCTPSCGNANCNTCGSNSTPPSGCNMAGPYCSGNSNCTADTVTPCTIPCPSSGSACGGCITTCTTHCNSCGTNSSIICPHTTAWCNGNYACNADTITPCTRTCSGNGICGSCTPTCTAGSCNLCASGCSGGACLGVCTPSCSGLTPLCCNCDPYIPGCGYRCVGPTGCSSSGCSAKCPV